MKGEIKMKQIFCFVLFCISINSYTINSQWFQLSSPTQSQLRSVYFINELTGWVCGDSAKIFKTTNSGLSWIEQTPFLFNYLFTIQFLDINTGFSCGGNNNDGKILKTTNGGTNWIIKYQSSDNGLRLMFPDNQTGFVVNTSGIILKTTNTGENWITKTFNSTQYYTLFFLTSLTGWIAGENGALYKTTNGGDFFYPQNSNTNEHIRCIKFLDQNIGFLCGGLNQNGHGIINKSTDGGLSWAQKLNIPDTLFYTMTFVNLTTGYAMGLYGAIYKTTNNGENWFKQYTGTNNFLIGSFFTTSIEGYTVGEMGVILKTTNGGVTFVNNNNEYISKFELFQNYPNPFNPFTTIEYSILKSGNVQIDIFDILGKKIQTLVNEYKTGGNYSVNFDGSNLPSGVYYCRLVSNGFSDIKKLVLNK